MHLSHSGRDAEIRGAQDGNEIKITAFFTQAIAKYEEMTHFAQGTLVLRPSLWKWLGVKETTGSRFSG